jgi:hypothetical protein
MGLLGNKTHHLNDYIFQFVKKKKLLGLYLGGGIYSHTPKLFDRLNCEFKGENNKRIKSWNTFFSPHHFKGRRVCWNFKMGIKTNDN